MSSPQHTTIAGTPSPTGLSAISQPPAQILEEMREGSSDEANDERAALLEKIALLDKKGQEKKARKKAQAERRMCEEKEQMAREEAERKAREEKKAHEDAVQKAREEAEKKAQEDVETTGREQARSFDLQAKRKAREESEKEAYERHAILLKERERKVREAAVLRTSSNSIISAYKSGDQDCGEGSSRKRARSTGSGSEVSSPVINKKRKQVSSVTPVLLFLAHPHSFLLSRSKSTTLKTTPTSTLSCKNVVPARIASENICVATSNPEAVEARLARPATSLNMVAAGYPRNKSNPRRSGSLPSLLISSPTTSGP
ncbi:hypothetical protein GGU11DRAFT_751962 [Lentinula aff. detonsa]|nr:hypothetical protein GGU11DRAFT_751962 [Lentinula aff. detonsa]